LDTLKFRCRVGNVCQEKKKNPIFEIFLCRVPLSGFGIGPDSTRIYKVQKYTVHKEENQVVFRSVSVTPDVPFGDCFQVMDEWKVNSVKGNENSVHVVIKAGVRFLKIPWKLKLLVETVKSSVVRDNKKFYEEWCALVNGYLKQHPFSPTPGVPSPSPAVGNAPQPPPVKRVKTKKEKGERKKKKEQPKAPQPPVPRSSLFLTPSNLGLSAFSQSRGKYLFSLFLFFLLVACLVMPFRPHLASPLLLLALCIAQLNTQTRIQTLQQQVKYLQQLHTKKKD